MRQLLFIVVLSFQSGAIVLADQPSVIRDFIDSNCADCHSGDDADASFDLKTLAFEPTERGNLDHWTKVFDRVDRGEMPPPDYDQLKLKDRQRLLEHLSSSLLDVERLRYKTHGRTVLRRLNRVEYEHTLQDILALPNLEIREKLPPDQVSNHFKNQAEALELSFVHMTRYLEAADEAIDRAIRLEPRPEKRRWSTHASKLGQLKKGYDINGRRGMLRQTNSAQSPFYINPFQPHVDGTYRFKVEAFGFHWNKGKIEKSRREQVVAVYASPNKSVSRLLHAESISRDPDKPTVIEFDAFIRAGERPFVYFSTLSQLNGDGWKNKESYEAPGAGVGAMSMEGPFIDSWPPASHMALFGDLPVVPWTPESGLQKPNQPSFGGHTRKPKGGKSESAALYMVESQNPHDDARHLLESFMTKACRGPGDASIVDRCLKIVLGELERQVCFQDAMRAGFKAALCSPAFLFHREKPGKLTPEALAARLSYFLWKSVPDEQLLFAARQGELSQPADLRAEVDRMLADERSEHMIEDMLGQWLDLDRIGFTQPDKTLYPEFDDYLRDSMIDESHATFRRLLKLNRPVRELIDSNEVMVNGRLAEHYGISGVEGVDLQPKQLSADSPRGGILTQGAVLTVTANGTNTSPVTRGAWVLDRLLGTPPPKPPSDVPAIEPDIQGATTMREQLAQHRDNDACRSCHALIDPPGFALENFDVMGAWRDRYRSLGKGERVKRKIKNKVPGFKLAMNVDASGQMLDGSKFEDIREFKALLISNERQIARNVVQRLIAYSTGSAVGFADRAEVETILGRTKSDGYRLRDLLYEVVGSSMFQQK